MVSGKFIVIARNLKAWEFHEELKFWQKAGQ